MMKILFVGDLAPHARSFQRYRAMSELGHDVRGLSFVMPREKDLKHNKHGKMLFERVFHKLGLPIDKTGINRRIIQNVEEQKPDVLWIEKGLMVWPKTISASKKYIRTLKLVSYSEDDMFARWNRSAYYRSSLPLYDLIVTTKSYNAGDNELPSLGARRVFFVDKAYDAYTHRPYNLSVDDLDKHIADVGFIGSYEQDRAEKMLYLSEKGINVRIWGNGWSRLVAKHERLRVENKPLYGEDYGKALCATKINLCFLRKINRDLQTDRTMEIPACGAFMLAERTEEHKRLFEEDKEAVFFDINDKDELLSKVRYYLSHERERKDIAKAGRQRCLNSGYSHHDRLKQIFGEL
jgi:spore maturation protein CgeB